ncbi:MAG: reverse transcriptase/maturase family protein [Parcubacteria group bacterium]|jgi:retron-type reverse transcriptase
MKTQFNGDYNSIISIENLLQAWKEFEKGKKSKKDVQEFSFHLMNNIFSLHEELFNHTYNHGGYQAFKINDPKPRDIHKASVKDRLLHHAIYRILYSFFDKTFIADSYSCRNGKGTHKAVNRFLEFSRKVSQNNAKTCWILKCDIQKFFANIDHKILLKILKEYIPDKNIIGLLENVILSFPPFKVTSPRPSPKRRGGLEDAGLPLGNLTSQLFVNIYMNKFDQFAKHKLKAEYYIRYADDFVIFSKDKKWLEKQIPDIRDFLDNELKLELHPDKVSIKTLSSGVDFLGMVNFSDHRILRTKTKRRMIKKLSEKRELRDEDLISKESFNLSLQSYLGILGHCRGYMIEKRIKAGFSCTI